MAKSASDVQVVKSLNLSDIQQLDSDQLGDFLRQDVRNTSEILNSQQLCQNTLCHCKDVTHYHVYEINCEQRVIICQGCFERGYRFCLFTHTVYHLSELELVLGDLYAHPLYHKGQLTPEVLSQVDSLYDYFKNIGIDNPDPTHSVVTVAEIDHLGEE